MTTAVMPPRKQCRRRRRGCRRRCKCCRCGISAASDRLNYADHDLQAQLNTLEQRFVKLFTYRG
jgi:hypothetical protein